MDRYSQQPWKPSVAPLPIPKKFKMFDIPKYDGTTDPRDQYNTKLRIEEDTITQSRKDERVSTRRAEAEKRSGKNRYEPYKGPSRRDSRSKQENQRYDHRSRDRESGSSSRFGKERNTREPRDDDRSSKVKIGDYSFNVSTSELVAILRSMGDKVRWPKEIRSNLNRRNPDFWCEFHSNHGHKMVDCRLLQGKVENLLKQGYLTELFSEKGKQTYMKNRKEPPKPTSPKRTVNVISGGEEINGVMYTATKKVSKITVTRGKRVRQVLEEESSSMNIILLRVVNEMQANDKLIPKAHTLSGFDNSSVVTKGEIILTIFAERVVKDMKFQVVEMDMAYNMILYRSWIHEMDNIKMDPLDEEKASFITNRGTYCYKVMSFGLKNVGATHQRLVTKMFQEQLGKTMEVYIDDILVKSQQTGDHIQHLTNRFQILRKFNIKLNPEKCAFGASSDFSQRIQLEAEKELQVFNGSILGTWTLFTDGSSNVKGAGLGIVLVPPMGETIRQAIKCHPITNNEAEYEAVIAGLELALELEIEQIVIKSDSQLVVNQMRGTYTAREARMQQYLEKARNLVTQFQTWKVMQIPREENAEANALANLASAA
ncbi:uncharacterized protein [Nicotiana sylvestris]